MNNSTILGKLLRIPKNFPNKIHFILIIPLFCLLTNTNSAWAWDFNPSDHLTAFNVDIGAKKSSLKIAILKDVDGEDDDNLEYAKFNINNTEHFEIICKDYNSSLYGSSDIFFETATNQDEEKWGIKLLGSSNANYILNKIGSIWWLEVTFDLAPEVFYAPNYMLVAKRIKFEDNDPDTDLSNVPVSEVAGWPEISLSGLTASNDNCSQVNLSWDAAGYQADMKYEVQCDGQVIASGQGQESYTHFLGEPEARGYNYTVEVGYGDNLKNSSSGNATGGPPRTGYNNVSGLTATSHTCNKITVSWSGGSGGSAAEEYYVSWTDGGNATLDADESGITIQNPEEQEYNIKVQTVNQCGFKTSGATTTSSVENLSAPSYINVSNSGSSNNISWGSASGHQKYFIEKSTLDNTIIIDNIDPGTTSYQDDQIQGCVTYTYRVFAANNCQPEGKPTSDRSVRITPNLYSTFTTNEYLRTSKGYYNDRVILNWENNNQSFVDRFKIYRREYPSGSFSVLETLEPTSTFIDNTVEPGVYYEYYIVAESDCEDDVITSASNGYAKDIGFAVPTGIVSGNVTFEGGAGVPDVQIIAETDDDFDGGSLAFNGSSSRLTIPHAAEFDFSDNFTFQAWIKPEYTTQRTLFTKGSQYEISHQNGKITFFAGGQTIELDFTEKVDSFFCVTAVKDPDSLYLYVLYDELNVFRTAAEFLGNTHSNTSSAMLGATSNAFTGKLDEFRLWDRAFDTKGVIHSSIRYISGNEQDLVVYMRMDEHFQNRTFDISRSGSNFNENHSSTSGCSFSEEVPTRRQLAVKGITDENGNYLITGIPYTVGSTYRFTPVFEVHEFEPSQRQLYIGPGSSTHNNIDFVDVAAFRITGNIVYEDTYFPVAGANFFIDGQIVVKADGTPVVSDEMGNYEIWVPIGWHYFEVRKFGHTFVDAGRFPVEGNFNFQEHISGINFTDNTKIKLIGRVAGGSLEAEKKAGLGLTNNNIGHATINLTTQKGYDLTRTGESGTWEQWIYRDELEEMVGATNYTIPELNPTNLTIYPDTETGEFVAYLLPEKYEISGITAGDYIYPDNFNTILDLSNSFLEHTETDSVLIDIAYDPDGNEVYYYRIDSVHYNQNHELIYRETPSIMVTNLEGEMDFWETEIEVDGVEVPVVNSDGSLRTPHPVFLQRQPYHLEIFVFERYLNADENNEEDMVPVRDGTLEIQNTLAIQKDKFEMDINDEGKAQYMFVGGLPNITTGGIGDYVKTFNMVARTGPNGSINTPWLPNNGDPFYGYVLGGMPSGNNFVTTGPNEVVMILRDPPGSNSYSYMEQGSEFSMSKTTEVEVGSSSELNVNVDLGARVVTFAGLGAGVITETETVASVDIGMEMSSSYVDGNTRTQSISTTQSWSTSDDPFFTGQSGDVFIGYSTNIVYGLSTQISLISTNTGSDHIGSEFTYDDETYDIGVKLGLRMDPEFNTGFIYTQYHIKNNLIPNLQTIRNNFLQNQPDVYQCVICDQSSDEYGRENETGFATETGYLGGDSYNIFIPEDWPDGELFEDSVAYFNKQIAGWEEWLAFNEEEKVLAELDRNISFDAGSLYESSMTIESSEEKESVYDFNISPYVAGELGFEVMGIGTSVSTRTSYSYTETTTTGTSTTSSQTFGYALADENPGDYFSVDIKKPRTATGTIFATKGGQSSCPYEGGTFTEYYQPGTMLDQATMQREKAQIECENPIQVDVLEDKPAIYNIQIQNTSETNDNAWVQLVVDDKSNQNGALVSMDGSSIGNGRLVYVMAGETVNKTITIHKTQPDIYDYENIKLICTSECDSLIYDYQFLTARFQPVCSSVELVSPEDQWVMNTNGDTTMLVGIGGYDLNHQSFQSISFQYKPTSSPNWTTGMNYYMYEEDYELAPEPKAMINGESSLLYEFDMKSMQDRTYDVKLTSLCADGTMNQSVIASGIKDVKRPKVFGTPQPADGILSPGDDVMLTFDENIQTGMLTPYNFSVRGVLNGQEIKHQTSIYFDGINSYLTALNGVNVNEKSFTVTFWVRRGDNQPGVIWAQNGMEIGFNDDNKFYFKGGNQTITSFNSYTHTGTWYHFGLAFDSDSNTYSMFVNDVIERDQIPKTSNFDSSGKMYVGRSVEDDNYFNGYLHEFRVWEDYIGFGSVYAMMYQALSGTEIGLSGYWPMKEASGNIAEDLSRSNNAMLFNAEWRVYPSGFDRQFDGVDDYVRMNTGSSVVIDHDNDFTIEFFFKAADQQNTVLFSNGNTEGTDVTPAYANIWNIGFDHQGQLYVRNNGTSITLENMDLTDDKWHHFALIVNRRANASVYINGELAGYKQSSFFKGLLGGDMVLGGRRNQTGLSMATVFYDQHYTGKIDEFRIWNLAKTVKQLNMDKNCALHGDEMGLAAYYPFDVYDYLGVMRIPSLADLTDEAQEREAEAQGNTGNTDVPNIKDARAVQNLTFDWVANQNEMIINVNEQPASIEKSIVEFTVDRVQDLRENRIASPVTWTAFIRQNTLIWGSEELIVDKLLYDPMTFEVEIENIGGSEQNYSVSNLPSWLTVNEPEGYLSPLSSKTLTFTVHEALNTGKYNESLYLSSDFGFNEKFELNLKVYKQAPQWEVDPGEFQYSFNVIAQLLVDSIISTDSDDMIGAFVGDECRGVSKLQYVMQQDNYLAFMDVYSNTEQGEDVYFKVWDASEGQIITNVIPGLVFEHNSVHGIPSQPLQLWASLVYEGHIKLNSGWNWVSFNLDSENLNNLPVLFKDVTLVDNTIIKGQLGFDVYSQQTNGWFGNLASSEGIHNHGMYMIKAAQSDTLIYEGPAADVTQPLTVVEGWNWIGFTPQVALSVEEAFASLNPVSGDFIKSQSEFAIYDESLGWIGSLDLLRPGKGYMFKAMNERSFNYPAESVMSKNLTEEEPIQHPWAYAAGNSSNNMSFVIQVERNGLPDDSEYVVGAFINGECRGVARTVYENGGAYYFLNVAADEDYEEISFMLYDQVNSMVIPSSEIKEMKVNDIRGSVYNPVVIAFNGEASFVDDIASLDINAYPNPFSNQTRITFSEPLGYNPSVKIYDVSGRVVYVFENDDIRGQTQIVWEGESIGNKTVENGIYFVHIQDNEVRKVLRLIVSR